MSREIDPGALDGLQRYKLLIACVVPRPIALIATVNEAGQANLAPFSFFAGVTAAPPTVMVSIGTRRGVRKDTARNLLAQGEGVIHIPQRSLAEQMVATSAEVAPEVDEIAMTSLATLPSVCVAAPRLRDAQVAMEVRVSGHQQIGTAANDVFFLEILRFHLDESILRDGLPDPRLWSAVGRLGGDGYATTADLFELPRPAKL